MTATLTPSSLRPAWERDGFVIARGLFDPADEDNGCTLVYPGYHHNGPLNTEDGHMHELPAGTVDESKAVPLSAEQKGAVVADAVLKPGGRLFVHVLTADRTVDAPERLRIVRLLADGPRNVTQIIDGADIKDLNVSHHLTVLKHAKLVRAEKRGRFVFYSLAPNVLDEVIEAGVPKDALDLGCCRLVLPPDAG